MEIEYLSREHLAGFNNYKYSARDTSPLSIYVMHPFWNEVVKLCPSWVAPNLLTFVGFLFTVCNFVLLSWYDWGFWASTDTPESVPVPPWVWLVAAVNIFLAHTLDGIDGKQARRTNTSGPLGEMFDHGLDSYTAVFIPACLYSAFGRGVGSVAPLRMYYVMWNIFWNFYLSHWEKYNTGTLFLPWGYDLSMIASTVTFLITGLLGHSVWKIPLPYDLTFGLCIEATLYICGFSNLPVVLWNIYKSYRDKTGHMRSFRELMRPLVSIIIFTILGLTWAHTSPNNIINRDPRVLYLLIGTVFSNISCRLIVSQMSNTRCELLNWMLTPYAMAALLSLMIPSLERPLIYLLCLGYVFAHVHYGTCVVRQMCRHFDRECFKVAKKQD